MVHSGRVRVGWVTALLLVAGCGTGGEPDGLTCGPEPDERPQQLQASDLNARLLTDDPVEPSTLAIDVTSTLPGPVELTVQLDEQRVVNLRVPGQPEDCYETAIYRYAVDAPLGRAVLEANSDSGHSDQMNIVISQQPQWAVIQLQDGIPLQITPYDHPPGWA